MTVREATVLEATVLEATVLEATVREATVLEALRERGLLRTAPDARALPPRAQPEHLDTGLAASVRLSSLACGELAPTSRS